MPDRMSEFMNRALREAAGRGVMSLGQPAQQAADDAEPPAEPHVDVDEWAKWARRAEHSWDQQGRLPDEDGYDPTARRRPGFNGALAWERRAHRWLARRKQARRRA